MVAWPMADMFDDAGTALLSSWVSLGSDAA